MDFQSLVSCDKEDSTDVAKPLNKSDLMNIHISAAVHASICAPGLSTVYTIIQRPCQPRSSSLVHSRRLGVIAQTGVHKRMDMGVYQPWLLPSYALVGRESLLKHLRV